MACLATTASVTSRSKPERHQHTPAQARAYVADRVEHAQGHMEWMGKVRGSNFYAWDGLAWHNAMTYLWELEFGRLPAGVMVVRACQNIFCVHPSHMLLIPVTLARTVRPKLRKCKRGHYKLPGVVCVPCRRKTWRDHNDRRRGKPMKSRWPGRKEWRAEQT